MIYSVNTQRRVKQCPPQDGNLSLYALAHAHAHATGYGVENGTSAEA